MEGYIDRMTDQPSISFRMLYRTDLKNRETILTLYYVYFTVNSKAMSSTLPYDFSVPEWILLISTSAALKIHFSKPINTFQVFL